MSETSKNQQLPEIEGLFEWPTDQPHLIGGACATCGARFFPKFYEVHKPDCNEGRVDPIHLSSAGKLMSYTICHYPPPPPCVAAPPYAIGLVEFPEGLQVAGIITNCKFEELIVGMRMEVVYEELLQDKEGARHLTWKYRPID